MLIRNQSVPNHRCSLRPTMILKNKHINTIWSTASSTNEFNSEARTEESDKKTMEKQTVMEKIASRNVRYFSYLSLPLNLCSHEQNVCKNRAQNPSAHWNELIQINTQNGNNVECFNTNANFHMFCTVFLVGVPFFRWSTPSATYILKYYAQCAQAKTKIYF